MIPFTTPFNTWNTTNQTPWQTPFQSPFQTPWTNCGPVGQPTPFFSSGYNGLPFGSNVPFNTVPFNNAWPNTFPTQNLNGFGQGGFGNTGFSQQTPWYSTPWNNWNSTPFNSGIPFNSIPNFNTGFNTPFNTGFNPGINTGFNTPYFNSPFSQTTPWNTNTFGGFHNSTPFTQPIAQFGFGGVTPWAFSGFNTPWTGQIPFGFNIPWNNTTNWNNTQQATGKTSNTENGTFNAPVQTQGVPFGFPVVGPYTPCVPVNGEPTGTTRTAA